MKRANSTQLVSKRKKKTYKKKKDTVDQKIKRAIEKNNSKEIHIMSEWIISSISVSNITMAMDTCIHQANWNHWQ